jgi:hypothetical protein
MIMIMKKHDTDLRVDKIKLMFSAVKKHNIANGADGMKLWLFTQ